MSHNDTTLSSQQIFLSSTHASQDISETEKIFNLAAPISPPSGTRILLSCSDFEMPYSMYNINSNNDKLVFTNGVNVTLTHQNYNINELVSTLDSGLTGISVSYSVQTNKITFTSGSAIQINTTTSTLLFEIGWIATDTQNATSIVSPFVCNLAGIPNIYIRFKNLNILNIDSAGQIIGTLAKVPVNVNPLEYIFYTPKDDLFIRTDERQINLIHLDLQDENGRSLEINGQPYSLTISVHFQHQRIPRSIEELNFKLENTDDKKIKE
ncbi:MAG: hypothetical protein CML45_02940 [Rhodobacteraceae bacterium]|nr:hypothetical protein [Paracoccaceae bacterium]|tara:strand:- start:5884 stop:6684 length:801 start_codon:yes stop_codon:yes gene_type:complete